MPLIRAARARWTTNDLGVPPKLRLLTACRRCQGIAERLLRLRVPTPQVSPVGVSQLEGSRRAEEPARFVPLAAAPPTTFGCIVLRLESNETPGSLTRRLAS